ncbi:cell wall hydrolase [Novosphingopyxis sp.]|uniref:cell wall hydrolase n=1 Tax=Novosphingopyxis sp. TaxID=2709690 RepID=UPI003B59E463
MFQYMKAAGAAAASMLLLSAVVMTDSSSAVAAEDQQQTTLISGEINIDPAIIAQLQADQVAANADASASASDEDIVFVSHPVIMPVPERSVPEPKPIPQSDASSLAQLVSMQNADAALDAEQRCLAGTIYFESKGESLEGQLAVAKVVLNRAASPRWPSSICGVVYQKHQFSFVRGGKMPSIRKSSRAWQHAKAIARIALDDSWQTDVDDALFFHAKYVSPGWRLTRIGAVDKHIFYR